MSSVVINIFDMMNPGDLLRRICSTNESCSCWAMSSQWEPCSVIWSGCCLWKCLIDWPCLLFNISDIKSFHHSGVEWFCEPAACCSSAFNLQENKCSCWVPVLSTRGHSKTVTLKRRVHWLMVNWWTTVVCLFSLYHLVHVLQDRKLMLSSTSESSCWLPELFLLSLL